MNRKAVAYTLVSIILVFVVASLFFAQNRTSGHESFAVVNARVMSMDDFITNLEKDSQRAAYIAGFRTLIAMEQEVIDSGEYFADAEPVFLEIFETGNLSTRPFEVMKNSTFGEYVERVQYEASLQGITFNLTLTDITLWQEDPWHILINYTFDLDMADRQQIATWNAQKQFTGSVPILDLRDPLYTKNTFARVQRVIKRSNVTRFVNDAGDANDTTGLVNHFNNSFYIGMGRGPSMLMRFEGNLTDSPYGIESLVDTVELSEQDLTVITANSVVDYQYFTNVLATACIIQNTPTTLKFADDSLSLYEIAGNLEYSSC